MAASRPCWKGYLKLSLVSCPIALHPATSAAERISFRQVNRRTGHRLKHKLVDSVTGEAVGASDKARGYEVRTNEFFLVDERELEQARSERPPPGAIPLAAPPHRETPPTVRARVSEMSKREGVTPADAPEDRAEETSEHEAPAPPLPRPENTHTIEIERFLPAGQIDARYFEKPYYIVPREPIGQEAFAVIRDAMRREDVIGLARVVLSSRERPMLVEPMGSGLLGVTLRFAHEVRSEADYLGDIPEMKLPAETIRLAQHIIKTKSTDFDPSLLEDHYLTALMRMLSKKQPKRPAHPDAAKPSSENVVSLVDALRRSLAAEPSAEKSASRRGAPKPTAAKRAARHRRAG